MVEEQRGVKEILDDAARSAWFADWLSSRDPNDAEEVAKQRAYVVDRLLDALSGLGLRVQGRPTLEQLAERMRDDPHALRVIVSMISQ
jgi:hypothetical protein